MRDPRTEKISVLLTPEVVGQLDAYADEHRWTRSTAAAELIEKGLRVPRDEFGQETVDNTNPVRPLLFPDPNRVCVSVQARGGDVWLGDSERAVKQARSHPASPGAMLLPAGAAPWPPMRGQQAVWIGQATPDKTCVVDFVVTRLIEKSLVTERGEGE